MPNACGWRTEEEGFELECGQVAEAYIPGRASGVHRAVARLGQVTCLVSSRLAWHRIAKDGGLDIMGVVLEEGHLWSAH